MDAKFLSLTALLAAAAFGSVWIATAPAPAAPEQPALAQATLEPPVKSRRRLVIAAPPEDVEPVSAYAEPVKRPAPSGASVYYPNCHAAWAAGVAPIYAGEPGYRPEMDGDGDGIACEPRRR